MAENHVDHLPQGGFAWVDASPAARRRLVDLRHVAAGQVRVKEAGQPQASEALPGGTGLVARPVQVVVAKPFIALSCAIGFDAER